MPGNDHDEAYLLTKVEYYKTFEPLYEKVFKPKVLIQFPVILPFHIPIADASGLSVVVDDHIICTYLISTLVITEQTTLGNLDGKFVPVEMRKSRVEMTYATDIELDWGVVDLTPCFDLLVEQLNLIITSYVIVMKDIDAHRVSREMFQMASLCRFIKINSWDEQHVAMFRLHNDVPYQRQVLTEDQLDKISWFAHILQENLNPFVLSEEIMISARKNFKEGFYRETVIYAQTSIETFFSVLFVTILLQEGKSFAEAEALRENTPFISLIKKEFHSRLGGAWKVDDARMRVGVWHRDTYILRNKVAHGGYLPSFEETQNALRASIDLRSYVVALIKAKKKKYPTLQPYFAT
jgi:hypothetical protein